MASSDHAVDLRVQAILSSRRRANASGQAGEDASNIRAAIVGLAEATKPNAQPAEDVGLPGVSPTYEAA